MCIKAANFTLSKNIFDQFGSAYVNANTVSQLKQIGQVRAACHHMFQMLPEIIPVTLLLRKNAKKVVLKEYH